MPDYMYMLESRLSAEQYAALVRVQQISAAAETNLYLVGGAVRDLISGMPIRDLDFVVQADPSHIIKELEKEGAQVVVQNEASHEGELLLAGEVDVSVAAASEEVYARPGTAPEVRYATITEDLRRRDFSINAIAISLNPNSRGLLLDPANGLADLERREIRALTIHSFTNRPVRLLRALRYASRMGFTLESRTADWFKLALERNLLAAVTAEDAGAEFRQVTREDRPAGTLKEWESHGFLEAIHPMLAKKRPDYDAVQKVTRVREDLWSAGLHPKLTATMTGAILGHLKGPEQKAVLAHLGMRKAEVAAVGNLDAEAAKAVRVLSGAKMKLPREAYAAIEKFPLEIVAFILAENSNSGAVGKIRNYLTKWRPLRQALPGAAAELESLGLERGPKFDQVLEEFFQAQLAGKARKPEDRPKVLRKLAGIKEQPKKPEKEEKKSADKGKKKFERTSASATPAGKPGAEAAATSPAPAASKAGAKRAKPGAKAPEPAKSAGKKRSR